MTSLSLSRSAGKCRRKGATKMERTLRKDEKEEKIIREERERAIHGRALGKKEDIAEMTQFSLFLLCPIPAPRYAHTRVYGYEFRGPWQEKAKSSSACR